MIIIIIIYYGFEIDLARLDFTDFAESESEERKVAIFAHWMNNCYILEHTRRMTWYFTFVLNVR